MLLLLRACPLYVSDYTFSRPLRARARATLSVTSFHERARNVRATIRVRDTIDSESSLTTTTTTTAAATTCDDGCRYQLSPRCAINDECATAVRTPPPLSNTTPPPLPPLPLPLSRRRTGLALRAFENVVAPAKVDHSCNKNRGRFVRGREFLSLVANCSLPSPFCFHVYFASPRLTPRPRRSQLPPTPILVDPHRA